MRPLIQAGKIKMLAVTSRKRVDIAPDVPTVAEAGFPFLGLDSLIGIYGPRGMSNALRESIAADVRAVVAADPTIAHAAGRDRPDRRRPRPGRVRRRHQGDARPARRRSPRRSGSRRRNKRSNGERGFGMNDSSSAKSNVNAHIAYDDLREWLARAELLGEVRNVKGASWQEDIGLAAEAILREENGPCVVFDEVPG